MTFPEYDRNMTCLDFGQKRLAVPPDGETRARAHPQGQLCIRGEPLDAVTLQSESDIDLLGGVFWSREAWMDFWEWLVMLMRSHTAARDTLCHVNTGQPCDD